MNVNGPIFPSMNHRILGSSHPPLTVNGNSPCLSFRALTIRFGHQPSAQLRTSTRTRTLFSRIMIIGMIITVPHGIDASNTSEPSRRRPRDHQHVCSSHDESPRLPRRTLDVAPKLPSRSSFTCPTPVRSKTSPKQLDQLSRVVLNQHLRITNAMVGARTA